MLRAKGAALSNHGRGIEACVPRGFDVASLLSGVHHDTYGAAHSHEDLVMHQRYNRH